MADRELTGITSGTMPAEPEESPGQRNDTHLLWLFLLFLVLTVGIRLRVLQNIQVVTSDAFEYKRVARYVLNGNWSAVVDHEYHPLYPAMMAVGYLATGDWALGGQLMSLLWSVIGGIGLFWFTWRLTGNKYLTLLTGLLYAIHPYQARLGVKIFTTGAYTGFVGLILGFAAEGIHSNRWGWWILAGLCIPLAFLVRLDGVLFLGVFFFWLLYVFGRDHEQKWAFFRKVTVLLCISIVPFLGFLAYRTAKKGSLDISGKVDLSEMTGKITGEVPLEGHNFEGDTRTQRILSMLDEIQRETFDGIGYFFLVFWVIGLFLLHRYTDDSYLLGLLYVHLLVSAAVFLAGGLLKGRLDTRHTVPLVVMSMPFAAVTLLVMGNWIHKKLNRYGLSRGFALLLVVSVLGAAVMQKTLKVMKAGELYQRELGNTIRADRDRKSEVPYIVTRHSRIVFYTGGTTKRHEQVLQPEEQPFDVVRKTLEEKEFDYIDLSTTATGDAFDHYYRQFKKMPFLTEVTRMRNLHTTYGESPMHHVIFRKEDLR